MKLSKLGILATVIAIGGCTMHHTIEPSDKPIIVNLNVKIDHEIRVKVRDENQDLLNLEDEVLKKKPAKKGAKG